MQIFTTTSGIYPKISSLKEFPNLRANLHKFDKNEIDEIELEKIVDANIKRAVEEQKQAEIDFPTCGLIRWSDLFSPFIQAWGGIRRRGIHRFYNTNTLYGEPVIEYELVWSESTASGDIVYAKKFNENIKATLPGVFTFAKACVDNHYKDSKKLREALAKNLLNEAKEIIKEGVKMIEIHEVELGWGDYDASEVSEIYKAFGELEAQVIVISYFRNFSQEIANALMQANVGIGIDTTQPYSIETIEDNAILQLGIVDSRETKLEDVENLKKKKDELIEKFKNASEIIFSNSSHVEYLPYDKAIAKINLLKNLK